MSFNSDFSIKRIPLFALTFTILLLSAAGLPEAKAQYGMSQDSYTLEGSTGFAGIAFDEEGAFGVSTLFGNIMVEALFKIGEGDIDGSDQEVYKFKGGISLLDFGSPEVGASIYGMAGYSSHTISFESGGKEDLSGFLIEPGILAGFEVTPMLNLWLGSGYVFDMGMEEEYLNFKFILGGKF